MVRTIRVYFANRRGYFKQNFNWPEGGIKSDSVVHISISEAHVEIGIPNFTQRAVFLNRWLGDAKMTVHNVSPHEGGVTFSYSVDFPHPLNIAVDITVFDPPIRTWRDDTNTDL